MTGGGLYSQFTINANVKGIDKSQDAYLYAKTSNGETLLSKGKYKGDQLYFDVKNPYIGMLSIVIPQSQIEFPVVSENKNIVLDLWDENKQLTVKFQDEANKNFQTLMDLERKRSKILPALINISSYYKSDEPFQIALKDEIKRLEESKNLTFSGAFTEYYFRIVDTYLKPFAEKPLDSKEMLDFFKNTGAYLENTGLLKNLLIKYLQIEDQNTTEQKTDALLSALGAESLRGQLIISELVDIFRMNGMDALADKYLQKAGQLKCEISSPLAKTLKQQEATKVGNKFPNYAFTHAIGKVKSLYDIPAKYKIVMFWSSTCSHCEKQLPEILKVYDRMKKEGIEVVGISLDASKEAYTDKVSHLPWINDSELMGWRAKSADTYGINATPTFFILDQNNVIVDKPQTFVDAKKFLKIDA